MPSKLRSRIRLAACRRKCRSMYTPSREGLLCSWVTLTCAFPGNNPSAQTSQKHCDKENGTPHILGTSGPALLLPQNADCSSTIHGSTTARPRTNNRHLIFPRERGDSETFTPVLRIHAASARYTGLVFTSHSCLITVCCCVAQPR